MGALSKLYFSIILFSLFDVLLIFYVPLSINWNQQMKNILFYLICWFFVVVRFKFKCSKHGKIRIRLKGGLKTGGVKAKVFWKR